MWPGLDPEFVRQLAVMKKLVTLRYQSPTREWPLVFVQEHDELLVIREWPDGSMTANGSVKEVSPRAMAGTVVLRGEPGRAVRIELPRRITLYSLSGGQVVFEDVVSDLPSLPRLDSNGTLTFRFGGSLRVSGNSEGDYRGDLPIIAEYL